MKGRRLLVVVLSVAVVVVLVWLLLPRETRTPIAETFESTAERTATSQPATDTPTDVGRQSAQPVARSRAETSKGGADEAVRDYVANKLADPEYDWKQPINFYGKAVDENEQPVEGASAHFKWTDLSANGTSEHQTVSDAAGLFSMENQKGKRLSVTVSKGDYYSTADARLASYEYANPADGLLTPEPNRPVIFHLRKKGETQPLVVMRGNMNVPGVGRKFALPTNGHPVGIDLLRGKAVAAGGPVEVQCWIANESGRFNEPYDWQYKITVPGGGISPATNEFNFEAPVEGYQPAVAGEVRKDLEWLWANKTEKSFFVRLADGKYALINFVIYAGRNPFCQIESFVNPSGSRNLELDPDNIIIAQ